MSIYKHGVTPSSRKAHQELTSRYKIVSQTGQHYTGRAGEYWLNDSVHGDPPFLFSTREIAQGRADRFNKFSAIHGMTFTVEEVNG